MFTIDQFAFITKGKVLVNNCQEQIELFLTDSRKLSNAKLSVFLAVKGERHDGHDYLAQMHKNGVRQFIVENEKLVPIAIRRSSSILLVDNSIYVF